MPRFFVDLPLAATDSLRLPAAAARHVQVLRLQPGEGITLFDGRGGEWSAEVVSMGRQHVDVRVIGHDPVERELPVNVTLVATMPANDRFDWLVEKATELGATAIEPVQTGRSVLRLSGERAERKQAHWQAVAVAAAEQSGRTRVPRVGPIRTLTALLTDPAGTLDTGAPPKGWLLLSLAEARPLAERLHDGMAARITQWTLFSGPEGGFTPEEEAALRGQGALPTTLGPRVLRAETAPLAVLAAIGTRL
jgi:16S rRNA (uracil1498-N3)-methyltransferase